MLANAFSNYMNGIKRMTGVLLCYYSYFANITPNQHDNEGICKRVAKMIPGREYGEDANFFLAAWLAISWSKSMMLHGSSASSASTAYA